MPRALILRTLFALAALLSQPGYAASEAGIVVESRGRDGAAYRVSLSGEGLLTHTGAGGVRHEKRLPPEARQALRAPFRDFAAWEADDLCAGTRIWQAQAGGEKKTFCRSSEATARLEEFVRAAGVILAN